jgi:hypothetical protein
MKALAGKRNSSSARPASEGVVISKSVFWRAAYIRRGRPLSDGYGPTGGSPARKFMSRMDQICPSLANAEEPPV